MKGSVRCFNLSCAFPCLYVQCLLYSRLTGTLPGGYFQYRRRKWVPAAVPRKPCPGVTASWRNGSRANVSSTSTGAIEEEEKTEQKPVKPYRTPLRATYNLQQHRNVVGWFSFSISIYPFLQYYLFLIEKFVILPVKYYPFLLHLQKYDTPKFVAKWTFAVWFHAERK